MSRAEIIKRIDRVAYIIEKDASNIDNREKAKEIRNLVKILEKEES